MPTVLKRCHHRWHFFFHRKPRPKCCNNRKPLSVMKHGIVQEFAYELAEPITTIFNTSLRSGIVPVIWKDSSNTIPYGWGRLQTYFIDFLSVQSSWGLRSRMVIDNFKDKIDPNQFGCLKGTSTTYCLLDMIHTWLTYLYPLGRHLRLCFLDFS